MSLLRDISVLILAGQREGVIDPLCADAGVARKALLPICGRPMIDYPLAALKAAGLQTPFHVSGLDITLVNAVDRASIAQSPSAPGPAGSALAAIEAGIKTPLLITTADHPLLTEAMLRVFLTSAKESGADLCVSFAPKTVIAPAYPHVKRTYLNFSDISVSGCNLFYIANQKGLKAVEFWVAAQHDRKKPWKLAKRFGLGTLLKYAAGRLSFDDGFAHASRKIGITIRPVIIPIAEAAIDVDKPSDKVLVEEILSQQGRR